ncbi:MAG: electron transport complex subunit RsxC [Candidatus Omnitrophota bacterium]
MKKTFTGGVHPPGFKKLSRGKAIKQAPLPDEVFIPLAQHTGAPCEPAVKKGDLVKTGQLIAKSDKFISGFIHSSISGSVTAVKNSPHPVLGGCKAIVIKSDGKDERVEMDAGGAVKDMVRRAGIVGMGGAAFPTHVKLSPPAGKTMDTFILNGVECEPYLSCDHRLMLERPKEILEGAMLIMDALGLKKCIVGIEANKPDAIEAMGSAILGFKNSGCDFQVVSLGVKYPQGAEKQLIKALVNREVPAGGLPFDVGVMVNNVGTALAVYEAVKLKKPLYERVVTVTGNIVKEPQNLLVRIGTPVRDLIRFCGGTTKDIGKIIMGGPMMGIALHTQDAPVIKGTSGILVLSGEEADKRSWDPCIRCGKCVDVCPAGIVPAHLGICAESEDFKAAQLYDPFDCIECGACAYVCPSLRPLVQWIKWTKMRLRGTEVK